MSDIGLLGADNNATELRELLQALKPLVDAIRVNDSDTLARLMSDEKVIWTATGSWSQPVSISLGDLRRISKACFILTSNPDLSSNT